jgi:hypothetical protein
MDLAIFRGKRTDYTRVDPNKCPYLIIKLEYKIELSQNTIYLETPRSYKVDITNTLLYLKGRGYYEFSIGNKLLYIEGCFTTCYHKYLVYVEDFPEYLPDSVMYARLWNDSDSKKLESMPYYMVCILHCYLFIQDNIEYVFAPKYLQCIAVDYFIDSADDINWYPEDINSLNRMDVDDIIQNAINELRVAVYHVDSLNKKKPSIIENKLRKHFDYKSMYISIA